MEQDEEARAAKAAGVTRLLEEHPETWRSALEKASALARGLPRDFDPAEESAHIFRAEASAEDQR